MTGDAALILRARGGDELAFRRLRDRYEDIVRRSLSRYFPPAGMQWDDLRQEAAFGFFKAVRDYKPGESSFRSFASLCIERQLITAVKLGNRVKQQVLNESRSMDATIPGSEGRVTLGETIPAPEREQPEQVVGQRGEIRALVGGVRQLSEMEREAAVGVAEGRSYNEISDRTGLNHKQIDNAHQRSQRKLARCLEPVA